MWISKREWRRHVRELENAERRANANELWAKQLVNSVLTSHGQTGVPIPVPSEKHYTPPLVLPATVQGWTQEEFIDQLTSDGTYKSQGEALEAWRAAQKTGRFPYQNGEEFVT